MPCEAFDASASAFCAGDGFIQPPSAPPGAIGCCARSAGCPDDLSRSVWSCTLYQQLFIMPVKFPIRGNDSLLALFRLSRIHRLTCDMLICITSQSACKSGRDCTQKRTSGWLFLWASKQRTTSSVDWHSERMGTSQYLRGTSALDRSRDCCSSLTNEPKSSTSRRAGEAHRRTCVSSIANPDHHSTRFPLGALHSHRRCRQILECGKC